jgi:hypothetical protein
VHYQYDPVQTTKTSVIGAINMLGLAKRVGAKIRYYGAKRKRPRLIHHPNMPSSQHGTIPNRQRSD